MALPVPTDVKSTTTQGATAPLSHRSPFRSLKSFVSCQSPIYFHDMTIVLLITIVSWIAGSLVTTAAFVDIQRSIRRRPPTVKLAMDKSDQGVIIDSEMSTTYRPSYRNNHRKSPIDRKALRWVIESIQNQLKDENTDLPNNLLVALRLTYTGKSLYAAHLLKY